MIKTLSIPVILLLLTITSYGAASYEILYTGYTESEIGNKLIRTDEELLQFSEKTGIDIGTKVRLEDDNTLIAVISPDESSGSDVINIAETVVDDSGNLKIIYRVQPIPTVTGHQEDRSSKPLVAMKLSNLKSPDVQVFLVDERKKDLFIVNHSIGKRIDYSNILREQEDVLLADYLPLDRKNRWTYQYTAHGAEGQHTFNIVSFVDGWSVFDNFFGRLNVGMRIDQTGELLVSTDKGISTFYNENVIMREENINFNVSAGDFSELLVVTVPDNEDFWFLDVYARGVGLIYHERVSPNGRVSYSLKNAKVRGKVYGAN